MVINFLLWQTSYKCKIMMTSLLKKWEDLICKTHRKKVGKQVKTHIFHIMVQCYTADTTSVLLVLYMRIKRKSYQWKTEIHSRINESMVVISEIIFFGKENKLLEIYNFEPKLSVQFLYLLLHWFKKLKCHVVSF